MDDQLCDQRIVEDGNGVASGEASLKSNRRRQCRRLNVEKKSSVGQKVAAVAKEGRIRVSSEPDERVHYRTYLRGFSA